MENGLILKRGSQRAGGGDMKTRKFGRIGWPVSEIGVGTWAMGSEWGPVDEEAATEALHKALDQGVNFIDTADAYGAGKSERLVAKVLRERSGKRPYIATKVGKRLPQQDVKLFSYENLASHIDRSLENLETSVLDLVQLHCPPTELYYHPEVFEHMDRLIDEGKILHYGVSVEKVEEAIKAVEYPGVDSVQIIYNMFRQRPSDYLFKLAKDRGVAVIARVPLASGLLSGRLRIDSAFHPEDHRAYNRNGEIFDVGETFGGVPFEVGLDAVKDIKALVPNGATMAQMALRWILMNDAVCVVIPGAKTPEQAQENAGASDIVDLPPDVMAQIDTIYRERIKPLVHHRW